MVLAGCGGGGHPAATPAPGGSTASPGSPSAGSGDGTASSRWVPRPGTDWQWQLSGRVDLSPDVPVYDVDGQETSAATVAALHARGRHVVCYVNVGAWEDFRPDRAAFAPALRGRPLDGWPDERWLDIRRLSALEPLIAARFDECRRKGFDAVEPDNVDGYANDSGFPLTAADQLSFNRMVARLAHDRGLSVALKNDLDQVPQLVRDFDFAVVEQCAQYDECGRTLPFLRAGKAVLEVEYVDVDGQGSGGAAGADPASRCRAAKRLGLSAMRKTLDLTAWRAPC
ncbi:endo alpha-1,4 polygalactosaminidase [Streptacidiphilus monticola]|uniref:Endo alpha-1,4 polygalactosaminidase n=1 Tax=Streptacidiphilus monticola TaxID=2161674 RepID=A0ABW1FZ43_9ACTN